MAGDAQVIVRLPETTAARDQFAFIVAFQAGAGHDIEYTVGAIPLVRLVAAALHFEIIDVLWVDGRPQITGDIGVRDLHAVDRPRRLVSAADMQLIVHEVRARDKISNHGEAVAAIGTGRALDIFAIHESRGRDGIEDGSFRLRGHRDGGKSRY